MKKGLFSVVTAAKLWLKYLIAIIIRSPGLILWQLHKFGHAPLTALAAPHLVTAPLSLDATGCP